MPRLLCFLALCLLGLPLAGCSDDPDRTADSELERDAERDAEWAAEKEARDDPADAIASALGQAFGGEGGAAETVDFRVLRDLFPDELDDFERVDASGERAGVAGFSFSQAQAEYRDGDRRIDLQIVDGGGIAQMTLLGATWMQAEFDRESRDGYERTTEYEGYPAFEKLRTGRHPHAELQVIVADRFFVSADGQNVDMDDLKDALGEIDLDDLEDLRDVGR